MTNNTKIILGLILLLLAGLAISANMKSKTSVVVDENLPITNNEVENVEGCYVATLAKDVYTLNVQDQSGNNVSGRLVFKNFEKDSSTGDFVGTYTPGDGILFGRYKFQSEGMTSDMEVIFKKQGNDFVRGYGDVDASGEKFVDITKVTDDTKVVFKQTDGTCATAL